MRKSLYHNKPRTRGHILRNARLEADFSLKELGNKVGVSESYMCRIENDVQSPTVEVLVRIFKALNCSKEVMIDWILEDVTNDLNRAGVEIGSLMYMPLN